MALMKREDGSFIPTETGAESREDNSWLDIPRGAQLLAYPRLAAGREKGKVVPLPHHPHCSTSNSHILVPVGTNATLKGEAVSSYGGKEKEEGQR